MSEEQAPAVPAFEKDPKSRPYVPSPGSESTREMREISRRRRDAEEKLQQHLQEADHLHEEHMKAHHAPEGGHPEGGHSEGGHSEGGHSEGGHSEGGHSEGEVRAEGAAHEGDAPDQEAGSKPSE